MPRSVVPTSVRSGAPSVPLPIPSYVWQLRQPDCANSVAPASAASLPVKPCASAHSCGAPCAISSLPSASSAVAPFLYLQLLTMVLFGYAVFGDLPDVWSLTGSAVIVASGVYLFHRERVRRGG